MKKYLWLFAAILAAFCLLFTFSACGGKNGTTPDDDDDDGDDDDIITGGGPLFELVLSDNWEHGEGYQGIVELSDLNKFSPSDLGSSFKFTKDQVWYLGVEFTIDRDLVEDLGVGLVDPSEAAGWWMWLSKVDKDDEDEEPALVGTADENPIAKDVTVKALIELTVYRDALAAGAGNNKLVFTTKDADGTKGTKDSGTNGPATLSFTMFNFADNEEDAMKATVPSAPPSSGGFTKTELETTPNTPVPPATSPDNWTIVICKWDDSAKEFTSEYLDIFANAAKDSKIVLTFSKDTATGKEGWGSGAIGVQWGDPGGTNNYAAKKITVEIPAGTGAATSFTMEIPLEDFLECEGTNWGAGKVTIGELSNGVEALTKAELWVPQG